MRYTSASIDRVREADIVKTIESSIELKKKGSTYGACCPFHDEKTPSFTVTPAKQIFKCFGCGEAGDGIKYVMLKENLDFIDAVEHIAKVHSIYLEKEEVTPEVQRKIDQKAEMYKVIETAAKGFKGAFKKLPEDHWAKKMLKEREFNQESIVTFQLGYNGIENKFTNWAIEEGVVHVAKSLFLTNTKNNSSYDFFRDRIIFPIHNEKGTVVGFGGRQSNDEKLDKKFKYINSKDNLIYDKGAVLYGLFQAKQVIAKQGIAILTEGYTDVISMHQHGCENAIASCGTALTNKQARLLKKYGDEIILLRDGDKAGIEATIKDIPVCLAEGLKVSVCILPEGEDPDSFARKQIDVAQWVYDNKEDGLFWKVDRYDFTNEKYEETVERIESNHITQIKLLQDKKIPSAELKGDELANAKEENKLLTDEIDFVRKQMKEKVSRVAKIDPYKKDNAVREISELLFLIKNEVQRSEYISHISKMIKVSVNLVKNTIGDLEEKATKEREESIKNGRPSLKGIRLPEGADKEEFLEGHGFVTVGNSYHFLNKNGDGFKQGTNFRMQPLFHIQGDKENKRLCEIVNIRGQKRLIDFDSEMLASFAELRRYLFRIGGFNFLTHNGINTEHFDKFVYRFEDQFEPALELLTLGWDKKGFYAFANGVHWKGKFRGVNQYGVMHLEGIDKTDSEYAQKIDYRYSPAFSVMHKDKQDGDDIYENDRYFVYKESAINLQDWMKQMITVFAEKGIIGVLFNFSSIFRDLFLTNYDSFPLLGGFGEKDSGKSAYGKLLQNFFYYRLPALDLKQATHVGFSRRLTRTTNTVVFCDEYEDRSMKEEIFDGLMGTWNGIGREKGKGVQTYRTSYDKINTAIYYAGQFMPTRKENALATRTISMFFQTKTFDADERANFKKLLNWTNAGISSLVTEVVQHRNYFENLLPNVHAETERELTKQLGDEPYQPRVFENVSKLLTTFRILKDKIDFPFKDKKVVELCTNLIIDNSEQISDSNGLTAFWSILTFLFERKVISNETDFIIDITANVPIIGERKAKGNYNNSKQDKILWLRLKTIYQHYNKEVSKREGVEVIGENTLRLYFKSRPYFIGLVKGKRFGPSGSQSCYAFNYTMMQEKGLLTLEMHESSEPSSGGSDGEDDDDLPF